MKIYTRTGDDGTTSLRGGRRISKHSIRLEAYGTVDELISWIGLLRGCEENLKRKDFLVYIQDQLMSAASALAHDHENTELTLILPAPDCAGKLEEEIDRMENNLKPLASFILPGGNRVVSYCHIARCVCRRAERHVLAIESSEPVPAIVKELLNRLSDYLFVLAREISFELDNEEIIWKK